MKCFGVLFVMVFLCIRPQALAIESPGELDTETETQRSLPEEEVSVCLVDEDSLMITEVQAPVETQSYNSRRVVFVHTDLLGSPVLETDSNGEALK